MIDRHIVMYSSGNSFACRCAIGKDHTGAEDLTIGGDEMTTTEVQGLTWHEVVSSNLDRVAHNDQTNTLYITFKDGDTYAYDGVGRVLFDRLVDAGSVGGYFHAHIRDQFATRKL